MNIKSLATIGLMALALTVSSFKPAEAANNNKALNQLAMQMYMQNQAAAGNPMYNRFNPLLTGNVSVYNNGLYNNGIFTPIQNASYGYDSYNNGFGNGFGGCNNGYSTMSYGNVMTSPQYNRLAQEAADIRNQLAYGNLPSWKINSLENKLNKIQRQQANLAASGYGSPYGYNGGFVNNLRNSLGI